MLARHARHVKHWFHRAEANNAAQDATEEYEPIHPPGTIEKFLPADKHLGKVSGVLQPRPLETPHVRNADGQEALSVLQNLDEFEREAEKYLSQKAWIYYSSGADSITSHRNNLRDWERIVLRPRILR
jgi:L-lactate dehydrogenase (cytochrome)